jgi:hypothetical protein
MTATALDRPIIAPATAPAAAVVSARRANPVRPFITALRLQAAAALAFSVAVSGVAAGHADAEVTTVRLVAGGAMVVAILAFSLGRHARLGRRWSYNAAGLLQVAATFGIVAVGLITGSAPLVLALLAAPAVVMLAMCLDGVRDALGQNEAR